MVAIIQNRVLDVAYEAIHGAFDAVSQLAQGKMMHRFVIGNMQRLVQVTFGNMIIMRDEGNGHPGANGADIACDRQLVFLLKPLESLYRLHRAKNGQAQRQAQ
jgi:hypothetical protein